VLATHDCAEALVQLEQVDYWFLEGLHGIFFVILVAFRALGLLAAILLRRSTVFELESEVF